MPVSPSPDPGTFAWNGIHFWVTDNTEAGTGSPVRRFWVWSGVPPALGLPAAGAAIHVVSGGSNYIWPSHRGMYFQIETGGSYSAGDALKTDSSGRAIAQGGSGVIVATALEASTGSGQIKWAVFV